jgi:imidazolonepropionase-like amidohydrolase
MTRTCALGLLLAALAAPLAADTLIHAGHVIDGKASAAARDQTLVVRDGRIAEVVDGFKSPAAGDTVIDLKSATVLPGLFDLHVHITSEGSAKSYEERFRLNPADYAYRSVVYAQRTLNAGFTTVRNLGDSDNVSIALRNAINGGWIVGPRIISAGKSIATTGGHADPTNGVSEALQGNPGPEDGVVNGEAAAMEAVRHRYKDGADMIKITATGGVLSYAKNSQNPQFADAEIAAIVATAKDYGMQVAAHAHGTDGIKRAVRAGVDTIEHGSLLDDEGIELMKQRGTWLIPTLLAGDHTVRMAAIEGYYPELIRVKAIAIGQQMQKTLGRAYKAGVKIAFGTDSGVSPHGENAREFKLLVDAGVPPMKALQMATSIAADVVGMSDRLGTLEAGKIADIVAVPGDPLADIDVMTKVSFVMKDGKVVRQ